MIFYVQALNSDGLKIGKILDEEEEGGGRDDKISIWVIFFYSLSLLNIATGVDIFYNHFYFENWRGCGCLIDCPFIPFF